MQIQGELYCDHLPCDNRIDEHCEAIIDNDGHIFCSDDCFFAHKKRLQENKPVLIAMNGKTVRF